MVPAPSAFSLAAARLGWSLPQTVLLSLHGRDARSDPPASAARRAHSRADLRRRWTGGAGQASHRNRLRRLAADRARSARRPARAHPHRRPRPAIRSRRGRRAQHRRHRSRGGAGRAHPAARARPADDLFEHDGQITKREVRAVTLVVARAAPRRIVVGHRRRLRLGRDRMDAGRSARCAPSPSSGAPTARRASAATPRPSACRASKSSKATAPAALADLAPPDAIFIGGGAADASVLDAAVARAASRRPAGGQRGDARNRGAARWRATPRSAANSSASRFRAGGAARRQNRLATRDAGDAMGAGPSHDRRRHRLPPRHIRAGHRSRHPRGARAGGRRRATRSTAIATHRGESMTRPASKPRRRISASMSCWCRTADAARPPASAAKPTRHACSRSPACRRSPKPQRSPPPGPARG